MFRRQAMESWLSDLDGRGGPTGVYQWLVLIFGLWLEQTGVIRFVVEDGVAMRALA